MTAAAMRQNSPMIMHRMAMRTTMPVIAIATIMTTTVITIMVITMRMITATINMTSIAGTTITTATPMLMKTNKHPPKRRTAVPDTASGNAPASTLASMPESEAAVLYRLMTWLSPSFPVGAFSYSSGIEWAVEAGDIRDAASLRQWLGAMLTDGAGLCDSIFLAQVHRAASSGDEAALAQLAELASAFAPSRERRLETTGQGRAFIEIARAAWHTAQLDRLIDACKSAIVYPVAVGLVSAAHGLPVAPTIHAFLHAMASNWISAGVRLVPLGQTDSQRLLAELEPVVADTAKRALAASLDDLGSATFRADLASMQHEAQYTRLFRS
jgi:urease accessory protein